MKVCNKCKQKKHFSEFYLDSYQGDGYKTFCKECDNAQSRSYWQKNKNNLTPEQRQARKEAKNRWKIRNSSNAA